MRLLFFIALFFSTNLMIFAKGFVVKDFDGDGKFDKVSINFETKRIEFILSSSDYEKQCSLTFVELDPNARIEETKKGFKMTNTIGNATFVSYFRYNRQSRRIELAAIKRTVVCADLTKENGETFFLVSTKELVAKWNSVDSVSSKVITLPTLKTKIDLESISLNNFNDSFLNKFNQLSVVFYHSKIAKLN
ncbi:hypothetical protein OBK20_05675 [Empedobacter falsenii]|uniref:hypothetical protein n=1 Tax=Empedobacter stercoris TaxID=1628248 RepID=UPI001CE16B9F|nr:hypothetical protein [Empedobacter stercoris]